MLSMKVLISILFVSSCSLLWSCFNDTNKDHNIKVVDFSKYDTAYQAKNFNDTSLTLNVAVSAIISPGETFKYYEELFEYISDKINHDINLKQRKEYAEVNNMLYNHEVDLAFICSGAYTIAKEESDIEILVVPVCQGKPYYQAYIITHKDLPVNKFEDFRDKKFAFTDPLSNTGKLYASKKITGLNTSADDFFSKIIYTHAHDISIQLVSKMVVDGATVDGLIYEYLATFYPEQVKNIKIIEKSEYFGIPPIVVPDHLDEDFKARLKNIFTTLHQDSVGIRILDKLLIDKFIEGDDEHYNNIRQMQHETTQ